MENIALTNIKITNATQGARITRVKNLTLKDVEISSRTRAMTVTDSYEVTLNGVVLKNENTEAPLWLKGQYTGAIVTDSSITSEQIESDPEVPSDAVNSLRDKRAW